MLYVKQVFIASLHFRRSFWPQKCYPSHLWKVARKQRKMSPMISWWMAKCLEERKRSDNCTKCMWVSVAELIFHAPFKLQFNSNDLLFLFGWLFDASVTICEVYTTWLDNMLVYVISFFAMLLAMCSFYIILQTEYVSSLVYEA